MILNRFNFRKSTKKSIISLSILVSIFLVILILENFNLFHFEIFSNSLKITNNHGIPTKYSIVTEDQPAGSRIDISEASLVEPGFVVVHMGPLHTDRGIAATNLLQPGQYADFSLTAIRNTKAGELFTVMIHKDNGDGILHLQEDLPIRSSSGAILLDNIRIF